MLKNLTTQHFCFQKNNYKKTVLNIFFSTNRKTRDVPDNMLLRDGSVCFRISVFFNLVIHFYGFK